MSDKELQAGLEAYADAIASLAAIKVVQALQSHAPFTPEDIERIKDHVSPNGVAYQNGKREGLKLAAEFYRSCLDHKTSESYVLVTLKSAATSGELDDHCMYASRKP